MAASAGAAPKEASGASQACKNAWLLPLTKLCRQHAAHAAMRLLLAQAAEGDGQPSEQMTLHLTG